MFQFISCLCLKTKKPLQTPRCLTIDCDHSLGRLQLLIKYFQLQHPGHPEGLLQCLMFLLQEWMQRKLATAAYLYWPVGCVCCWCANAVPAVSNTSWGICWNQVNIYECCCCGLFLNGIWLVRCLSEWWRQEARGWWRGGLWKKKKEKRRRRVFVLVKERARIEKELHTVHIDPAIEMVMLQSSDLAPGLEIYSF